ncbi:hypothetical protein [Pseudoroseicyclus tamaricis]|uniref:hypothetical protein n=1 Tax=Pseudoroseicyclus tamaricis TaxID=2705421 RepID=UPI001433133A|nr:hypothetical protein [Pseudoroseicyclus tamaricis]
MQSLVAGTKGLTLLVEANRDRLFYALAIIALLSASAWISSLTMVLRTTVGQPV